MRNIAKGLRDEYPTDQLYLLLAKRNSGSFTYDGIERGGERVCAEIEEEIKSIEDQGGKISKLSIIGYSLGGLVSRYAVGLLYAKGVLDKVECMVRIFIKKHIVVDSDIKYFRTSLPLPRLTWAFEHLLRAGTTTSGILSVPELFPCLAVSSL